jgi:hypothetical protein
MSITAEERAKVPEEDFAGPHRSFPIRNQQDVHDAAALIGKAEDPEAVKREAIRIAKRKGLTIPQAWKSVGFVDEPMVESDARIFRFGHFPTKLGGQGWGVTRDEFIAVNGESGTIPVGFDPINLKHYEGQKSALDGRTGTATFTVDGDEVKARVKLPPWLDEVRKELGLKISSVIGQIGKELRKIDLVHKDKAHIKDAVFFTDEDGDVVLFEDDEPAVEFCDDGDMAQQAHEMAAAAMPHLCSASKRKSVHFSKETDAERGLRQIHDHSIAEGGAYCPGMGDHHGEVGMTDDEIEEMQEENDRLKQELAAKDNAVTFTADEKKAMQAEIRQLREQGIADKAVTFAKEMTTGKDAKAHPAERKSIVEGYKRAAAIDARLNDTVTFTDEGKSVEGSYLDAFKAGFKLRPRVEVRDERVVNFARDLEAEPVSESDTADAAREAAAREERKKATQAYAVARNGKP